MSDCDKCSIVINDALRDLEKTEDRYHECFLELMKERAKWQKLRDHLQKNKDELQNPTIRTTCFAVLHVMDELEKTK